MKKALIFALLAVLGLGASCAKSVKYDPNDGEQTKTHENSNELDYEGAQEEDKYNE